MNKAIMMEISNQAIENLPALRDVISKYGLSADKKLGQNFLLDLNLTYKIAKSAGDLSDGTIFEIGPGPGGLTRGLLLSGAKNVIAIEKDKRCLDILNDLIIASQGRLNLYQADALKVDLSKLGDEPRRVIANLPYNIATPLLINWLKQAIDFKSFTLMFQKEVAERICAHMGSNAYGRLSILCNWRCKTKMLHSLPPRAFTPAPKVSSAVVHLIPYDELPYPCAMEDLEMVTKAAFGQRRKMLRQSLKSLNVDLKIIFDQTNIDPTARAENLTVEQFASLANCYQSIK